MPAGPLVRAMLYVAAPGGVILSVDGRPTIASTGMAPWLSFNKTMVYQTLDISPLLIEASDSTSRHVLGFDLGHGFWAPQAPILRVKLSIVSGNASFNARHLVIVSGETEPGPAAVEWQATVGPVLMDDPWKGYTVDTRVESQQHGWNTPFFNASGWSPVSVSSFAHQGRLIDSGVPRPTPLQRRQPIKQYKIPSGDLVFDFGVNVVGVTELQISGPSGSLVVVRHGEWLNPNHTVVLNYSGHNATAFQCDTFVLSASSQQEPLLLKALFTWHGFQFAQVTLSEGVMLHSISSVETGVNVSRTGALHFPQAATDPVSRRLQQLYDITVQTQRNNIAGGLPTDCPTREKHGWLGDALGTAEEALYNFDMASIYYRFIMTIADDQSRVGTIPGVVPQTSSTREYDNSWTSAFPRIVQWMYRYTGDDRLIHVYYEQLALYMDHLIGTANHSTGLNDAYTWGDWCAVQARPLEVQATGPSLAAFNYLEALRALTELADVLGKPIDSAKYAQLLDEGRKMWHELFFNQSTHVYGVFAENVGSITAAALALNAVPAELVPKVTTGLQYNLEQTLFKHFGIGSVGAKVLFPQLSAWGLHSTALDLIMQDSYPSFGYWLTHGASTCWENWSGYPDETHPPLPTHGHIFLCGGAVEWMWRSLAGLSPLAPAYNVIRLAPQVHRTVGPRAVAAVLRTVRGDVYSEWTFTDAEESTGDTTTAALSMNVTLPISSLAEIYVPLIGSDSFASIHITEALAGDKQQDVWVNGHFVPGVHGVVNATRSNKAHDGAPLAVVVSVLSGSYAFHTTYYYLQG